MIAGMILIIVVQIKDFSLQLETVKEIIKFKKFDLVQAAQSVIVLIRRPLSVYF